MKLKYSMGLLLLLGIFRLGMGHAFADTLGAMQGYSVPNGMDLYGITERQDGSIWFTQESSSTPKIWKFDRLNYNPANPSAAFSSYTVGATPDYIVSGPSNSIYARTGSTITKIDSSNTVSVFTMPGVIVNGMSQQWTAQSVTYGPDGNVWVLAQNSGQTTTNTMMQFSPNGTLLNKFSTNMPGSEVIWSSADYVNKRIWVLTRSYSYPAGYSSRLGYYDMSGNLTYYNLGISSALGGAVTSSGKYWVVGDGNKLQSIDANGNMSSVYTLPYSSGGIWRVAEGPDGYLWATLSNLDEIVRVDESGNVSNATAYGYVPGGNGSTTARPIDITAGSDGNMWFTQYNNSEITKIGTGTDASGLDTDHDGLSRAAEFAQGTSDYMADTDSDGLSDYVESTSYPSRNAVFCDSTVATCAYPHPLQKDVYVEADWMNDGTTSYQLTQAEVSPIVQAYANHGISLTIDYGQLGGANEVPYNSPIGFTPNPSGIDYYDYKKGNSTIAAQFSPLRKGIFRYLLLADEFINPYDGDTTTSGVSNPSDDDILVSYGLIKSNQSGFGYTNFDTAISGTVMHELGHSVCLTHDSTQFSGCQYSGIDQHDGTSTLGYDSVMNYDLQMLMVDYSNGSNGAVDHDDWSAIVNNINSFALKPDTGDTVANGAKVQEGLKLSRYLLKK